ncbi:MAG: Ig-like domain-containing protein, partial [Clostridia bacterium]|nr:Ig-like domain-containing protein [Clostridia bacterium]
IAPKKFDIQVSYDGIDYRTVSSGEIDTVYPTEPVIIDLEENAFGSYVRFCVTERNFSESEPYYYVQCAEIGVYGVKNVFAAELEKTDINLLLNDTIDLDWEVTRNNTYLGYENKIEWISKDESIATVDKDTGLVTGKSIGKTKIIATNITLNYSAEVDVNVCEKLPYKRDSITISAFSPPTGKLFTNEHYATMAAADIDLIINSCNVSNIEDNLKMLEFANNNGMNSIVADGRLWNASTNISKELAEEVYQDYKGISNLEGVYLHDEPWNANIYAQSAENLADVMPGSFVYLNFFPGYIYNSFEQYEYTYDDLAALTDGKVDLMFDVYPFMADGSTNYNYLFNCLESIRRSGLKYDMKTAACMQTHGYGPANGNLTHRDPSFTDMRYQGMTYLAYGIKHLSYWKYSSSASVGVEQHNLGAIDLDGNTTPVYDRMKAVNPILHTVGAEIFNCEAREVYITGTNLYGQKTVPSTFFAQPGNPSQNLVFSYLKDKETGRNYLMVVNSDLENTVTVPLTFASGIDSIEILDNNTGVWSESAINGKYNVTLQAGDAAVIAMPEDFRYVEYKEAEGTNPAYHKTVYGDSSLGTPGTR